MFWELIMNEQWFVYLDADGVISDFEGKVSEINKMPFHKIPRGRMWKSIEDYDRDVSPFFETLELMPDALQLVEFVTSNFVNVAILTATGHVPKGAAQQKRNWFAKKFGHGLVVKTVINSEQKAQFANARSILIDDRMKSIGPWTVAGGIGILHTDANSSIAKLKEIIGNATR